MEDGGGAEVVPLLTSSRGRKVKPKLWDDGETAGPAAGFRGPTKCVCLGGGLRRPHRVCGVSSASGTASPLGLPIEVLSI
jgi:hypothetical protein